MSLSSFYDKSVNAWQFAICFWASFIASFDPAHCYVNPLSILYYILAQVECFVIRKTLSVLTYKCWLLGSDWRLIIQDCNKTSLIFKSCHECVPWTYFNESRIIFPPKQNKKELKESSPTKHILHFYVRFPLMWTTNTSMGQLVCVYP